MNIWEIVALNDLVKILKDNEKKFVIVAITLNTTPANIVKAIKKFLKQYAKLYENLTFLYYEAEMKDLGRINLLNKNVDEYPFVYHIYNTSEIFVSINRANETSIYEAFGEVEEYYKKDLQQYLSNKASKASKVSETGNIGNISNDKIKQDEIDAEMNRKILQHQKLLERIENFEKKKERHNLDFLQDIKQRKKDELKQKKDNIK